MPAQDFNYDPNATLAANYISNEVIPVNTGISRGIFPEHAPFYGAPEGLVVEARQDSNEWVTLQPNKGYVFSPVFIEAAAKTAKEVFTYIVLVADWTEVRLTYRAVGKYQDEQLLTEVASTSFDRSDLFEWSRVIGSAAAYHPRVRNPELANASPMDILNIGLEKITLALASPNSSSAITTADITKMQQQIASLASTSDVESTYLSPSATPLSLPANITGTVMFTEAVRTSGNLLVTFKANDGRSQILSVLFTRNGTEIDQTVNGEAFSDSSLITIDIGLAGDRIVVNAQSITPGTFTGKFIYVT